MTKQPKANVHQLAELSAVMRAIALTRPNSAPMLRLMADAYEWNAAASEMVAQRR